MQHPPYRELFDFRPTAGPSPLLLILGKPARRQFAHHRPPKRPCHASLIAVDVPSDGARIVRYHEWSCPNRS